MEKDTRKIEEGCPIPDSKYHIEIMDNGPYLVYGSPNLQQEILKVNEEKIPWEYVKGNTYSTENTPTALCRCGHSKNHPYCDGSHLTAQWDSTLSADNIPLLKNAKIYDGPSVELADNIRYCVHARICMARGTVWDLTEQSDDPEARKLAIYESTRCPSGRLKLRDKKNKSFFEPPLQPELGLIEDPQEGCSGPIWVKGGIPLNGPTGIQYEQRNRVTLCRCGSSHNKPFCDGNHATFKFQDNLPVSAKSEKNKQKQK